MAHVFLMLHDDALWCVLSCQDLKDALHLIQTCRLLANQRSLLARLLCQRIVANEALLTHAHVLTRGTMDRPGPLRVRVSLRRGRAHVKRELQNLEWRLATLRGKRYVLMSRGQVPTSFWTSLLLESARIRDDYFYHVVAYIAVNVPVTVAERDIRDIFLAQEREVVQAIGLPLVEQINHKLVGIPFELRRSPRNKTPSVTATLSRYGAEVSKVWYVT